MELGVIDRMGFNAYFLIVWDFVKWAKEQRHRGRPGPRLGRRLDRRLRLRITDVDPLRYDLLFERFLNPERVSMPDIDIDFSVRGRERVMQYVDREVRPRVGRADHHLRQDVPARGHARRRPRARPRLRRRRPAGQADPRPDQGRPPSFEDCLQPGQELRKAYDSDPTAKQIVDVAQGLEGIVRNSSIHAAAVVIAGLPLTDIVPLQLADSDRPTPTATRIYRTVTQFSMKPVEELGLLKMDFLGLRNLDVIEDALDIIERSTGERPDMTTLPLDDAQDLRDARPRRLDRRVPVRVRGHAGGAAEGQPDRVRRPRRARRAVPPGRDGPDPDLRARQAQPRLGHLSPTSACAPIIGPTKGVILYQEQAMQISKELAGFSGAKADDLRKAIGKKNREAMATLKPEFVEGCRAQRRRAVVIDWLWATNEKSADYSFNKSHAACYALIAYRTAWLKANYPAEYMAALISSVMSTKDKVPFFVAQARGDGHRDPAARRQPLRPRVHRRRRQHPLRPRRRQGRRLRGGRGDQGARARRAGRSTSIWDFCARVDPRAVNKKAIEALIKCGAFGSTGASRKGMLGVLEQAQAAGPEGPAGRADRPGLDLRPRRSAADRHRAPRPPSRRRAPADPDRGVRAARAAGHREGGDRPVHLRAPAQGGARGAARRRSTARWPSWPSARTATGSRSAASSRRRRRSARARATHMMFATLDDLEGSIEMPDLRQGARGVRGRARRRRDRARPRPRRPRSDKGTSIVAQTVEPFRPTQEEVEAAREAAALDAAGPAAADGHARRHARCRRRSSTSSSTCSATTPASPRSSWRSTPRRGRARCAWARTTASSADAEPARRAGIDPRARGAAGRLTAPRA